MDRNYPGPCWTCCTCPTPYLGIVNRSGGCSACGFFSDGMHYLQSTYTETLDETTGYDSEGAGCTSSYYHLLVTGYTLDSTGACPPAAVCQDEQFNWTTTYVGHIETSSSPLQTVVSSRVKSGCDGEYTTVGVPFNCLQNYPDAPLPTITTTYSQPFTTSMVQGFALANLNAATWPAFVFEQASDGEVASAELSSNGFSYSVMDGKYQWAHPVHAGGIYKLAWIERFTPDSGAVVDTPRAYQWNGTKPPGYNLADPSTWPTSPVFEVDHPSANGSISVVGLTVDCGGGPVAA